MSSSSAADEGSDARVGLGVDAHRFASKRPLVLGGVEVQASPGLSGHSDGDVLSHAIADALLGAAGMGDLGEMFPADERWKDASSLAILREVARVLSEAGWSVGNLDATVAAESPRLASHRGAMISNIAASLAISESLVSVKSTTTDGLGFVGRGEGIAALAIARVERPADRGG
jgi:2-C-methyl-D-erythritol 2,4-cyclodiphosphate synthase